MPSRRGPRQNELSGISVDLLFCIALSGGMFGLIALLIVYYNFRFFIFMDSVVCVFLVLSLLFFFFSKEKECMEVGW